MKLRVLNIILLTACLFAGLLLFSSEVLAQKSRENSTREEPVLRQKRNPPPANYYRLDDRHLHNYYYPRSGHVIKTLPSRRTYIHHRNRDYFFYQGIWYRPYGVSFEVIVPPFGITVPILPPVYSTIWVHGRPYYYANNVYYLWREERDVYEVVAPPKALLDTEPPLAVEELIIYPANKQSDEELANDRYECHRWSREQSGYDPTQVPETLSAAQLVTRRSDYQRAMRACLEGRGYTVR